MTEDFYCEQILSGKTLVDKVLETANVLGYHHTNPFWETHIVVFPKKHVSSLLTLNKEDELLFFEIFRVINQIADAMVKEEGGARVLTNLGKYQESKHLHFHICSGKQIRPDMET